MDYRAAAERAAQWALTKLGCAYSQERRTQTNIFDCSSLAARAYSAQGKKWSYGGSVPRSNQEVYDDDFELIWPDSYAEIGKRFGGSSVIERAKQAGDLQFLCTESGTARANRITHVSMVADAKRIVHARGKAYGVCTSPLNQYSGKVCALVRYNPEGTLRIGMKGHRTLALQQKLNRCGAALKTDGEYGNAVADAVRAIQAMKLLPVSGEADAATLRMLEALEADGQTAAPAPEPGVLVTGDKVNVRLGPGTGYASVKLARKGEVFKAIDTDGWLAVELNEEVRWISKKYARPEADAE